MKNDLVLGVDIGGSHITAALVDLNNKSLLQSSRVRELVEAGGTAEEIIYQWVNAMQSCFLGQGVVANKIGIAMPGPFDYENGTSWMKDQNKYDTLYGLNVRSLLADALSISPDNIKFVNDAEGFLKGEIFTGAAKTAKTALGITLGTGLGSAIYKNKEIKDADLWHSSFKDATAEDYLSGRWFLQTYFELTGRSVDGVKELAALASTDDSAKEVFKQFGKNLASFLNQIIKNDLPEIIVLGGSISKAYDLFKSELEQLSHHTKITTAVFGEDASLIGAASCWAKAEETAMVSQTI
jgi:glucokinase